MGISSRLHTRNEKQNPAAMLVMALVLMYAVSALLLMSLALLLDKLNLSEGVIRIGVIVTYVLSCLAGGFFLGKKMKDKKYLWGLLGGCVYFGLLFFMSVLVKQGMGMELFEEPIRVLTALILCTVSGMAGGMVS